MKELYELKESLMDELKDYGRKDMTATNLEVVDKLTHTIKNLCKIIADGEYSNWDGTRSYRRDSMGRYARDGYSRHDLSDKLRELMNDAPDDRTRMEIQKLVDRM